MPAPSLSNPPDPERTLLTVTLNPLVSMVTFPLVPVRVAGALIWVSVLAWTVPPPRFTWEGARVGVARDPEAAGENEGAAGEVVLVGAGGGAAGIEVHALGGDVSAGMVEGAGPVDSDGDDPADHGPPR